MSKQVARLRLETEREKLTVLLSANHTNRQHVRKVMTDIAALRLIAGPPQYFPREWNTAPKQRNAQPRQALGDIFDAHLGKRA
jgi:hypothetical protein